MKKRFLIGKRHFGKTRLGQGLNHWTIRLLKEMAGNPRAIAYLKSKGIETAEK